MFSFLEEKKILQRLILKYSSSTNCLITVHSYNLETIKLLNAKKIFKKNVEIGVQEILKSAIIPLESSKIPEIIRVKV